MACSRIVSKTSLTVPVLWVPVLTQSHAACGNNTAGQAQNNRLLGTHHNMTN